MISSHSVLTSVQAVCRVAVVLAICSGIPFGDDRAPSAQEQQLPYAMHAPMSERPTIRVGHRDADVIGTDHRALQAAVDYVASLGGGVVEIGPGEYLMGDSLHLRSHVTVRGQKGKTILRKADAAVSPLALDADFGEEQVTVQAAAGFIVGAGIAIWDDHAEGFHITVARITGRSGNTFSLDDPLMSDCMTTAHAMAATVYPVVSGSDIRAARIENLTIEGNKGANPHLDGCRGAGIYLNRAFGVAIHACVARNYHGDGISFQQSNDVTVTSCISEDNTHLGLHPGSGSQRAVVRDCVARRNGSDGLYLCWRVRHGVFQDNRLEENGRFGISIGHKDSDNVFCGNQVLRNDSSGVCFRDESTGMSPHRNRLERNVIADNGRQPATAGIQIDGEPDGLILVDNTIRDSRAAPQRTQTVGIVIQQRVGSISLERNRIDAGVPIEDHRAAHARAGARE
jgi:hypothetical protein